ncbi:RHS repeat domain-containing protein [Snodgrassella alvi]|uniref:RHS repeat domain-containing protein n=2 Tax=Snodgrassella TaxID=1193515 RepID=UPI00352E7D15
MQVAYGWAPDSDWGTNPLWQANLNEGQTLKNASYHYLITDHLGTPQLAINSAGEQSWKITSDAFGNSELDANNQITMNLRFPGQYYDEETGLTYNYFRDYDAKTGRYIQNDPIGLNGGINIYEYSYSNPLNFIDFYGLAGRGGRQNSKGERNRTKNSHGTDNPYKHWRLDKKNPGKVFEFDQWGKKKRSVEKPEDWDEYKNEDGSNRKRPKKGQSCDKPENEGEQNEQSTSKTGIILGTVAVVGGIICIMMEPCGAVAGGVVATGATVSVLQ